MSTVSKISQLSHRIFNTSVTEKSVARSSNPFAASNFQKNILNADVVELSTSKNKTNINDKISASSKRIYSTFVGSINDFGTRLQEGIESIVEFGRRMKDGIVTAWNRIQEIGNREVTLDGAKAILNKEISLDGAKAILNKEITLHGAREVLSRDITSFFGHSRSHEITKMSKMDPHAEVKPMLVEALSALEADMVQVA